MVAQIAIIEIINVTMLVPLCPKRIAAQMMKGNTK